MDLIPDPEIDGLDLTWAFPSDWTEARFPETYNQDDGVYDSQSERNWKLSELRLGEGRIEIPFREPDGTGD